MLAYILKSGDVKNNIFIPKYYDPELHDKILELESTHDLFNLGSLIEEGKVIAQTGHEIGKMAYGTGNIPFVRTSDITNWEIKTIPKQGVSEEIYQQYAEREDVLVQHQIRNMQFTADIIDTLGSRYKEIVLPIPKAAKTKERLIAKMTSAVETRMKYKAAIKQMPILIEKVLDTNSTEPFETFFTRSLDDILEELVQDTTTLEFGEFSAYKLKSSSIISNIFLPKYYDPSISTVLDKLSANCTLKSVQELINVGILELATGDEIGKMAYGTGNISFVRTSDFSNWEIKADAKQGVSEEIYQQYAEREDVQVGDILLVRDGTYLVGTSCMITECDKKMLYCGGLIKIRSKNSILLNEYLLLGLLNSYIVKRQIRTKQFTRDVIDTLGQRLKEVVIPIPNSVEIKTQIAEKVKLIIQNRIEAREIITQLSDEIIAR